MILTDTHSHIYSDKYDENIEHLMDRALKNNIKRFVMTSSVAAVGGSNHKNEYDDTDWTDLSMNVAPYQTSKTKAEKFLWDFMEKNKDKTAMQAVAINPSLVVGESLSNDVGTSNLVVKRMIDGSLPFAANICINIVHIKCIADLHVQAMTDNRAVGKRFVASTRHIWFPELAKLLRENGFSAPRISISSKESLLDKEGEYL